MLRKFASSSKAQSRILEAVIAAVIIFIVFSGATFLIRSSDVAVLQERGDLDRTGYNVLTQVIETGSVETILEKYGSGFMEDHLRTVVQKSLPPATYFNLTVYQCLDNPSDPSITLSRVAAITNITPELGAVFTQSKEISSTPTVYSSKNGNLYYIILTLAKAGEAG